MDVAVEELQATAAAVDRTTDDIGRIETTVTSRVGAANAPKLETLIHVLKEAISSLPERPSISRLQSHAADADAREAADRPDERSQGKTCLSYCRSTCPP